MEQFGAMATWCKLPSDVQQKMCMEYLIRRFKIDAVGHLTITDHSTELHIAAIEHGLAMGYLIVISSHTEKAYCLSPTGSLTLLNLHT